MPEGTRYRVVIGGAPRAMCCAGCAAVARAIVGHGLETYYQHRSALPAGPDVVPQALEELRRYDLPDVQRTFVRAGGDHVREASLMLEGITCAACVWLNEQHLARLPGVLTVEVNYATHRARVRWDERRILLSDILAAVNAIGYRAYPYDTARSEETRRRERKLALWRLFIAGFGMMQVMMYLVPVYVTAGEMTPDVEQLMRLASLALTAPVVFYSAVPFFAGGWRDLRTGRVGMDVPVVLGIGAAFVASVIATLDATGDVYYDSITMFVFLLLGARYLEMTARGRAAASQERLVKLIPALAERLPDYPADERAEAIPVSALAAGDHVRVRPGATIPADGVVVAGATDVNESLLTGESRPVAKQGGEAVVGGSLNTSSPVIVRVTRIGEDTLLASILRLLDRAATDKPRLAQLADRVAQWFVAALLAIAAAVALAWYAIDPDRALWVTVAVLVVSCPCALSLATPAALTAGTGALHARGVLVTRGHALETLAHATHFVFDKTGTITEGVMRVAEVMPLADLDRDACLALAAAVEAASEHPVARAIVAAAGNPAAGSDARNVPGRGMEATVAGRRVRVGEPAFVAELSDGRLPEALARVGEALTVVAVGDDRGIGALIALDDPLRADATRLVASLRGMGKAVCLLSGDRPEIVGHIAAMLGVAQWRGGASPQDKVEFVRTLQQSGAVVAMVGDGINDAAVLAQAQVSLAMGSGADLAQSSSDMVLLGARLGAVADTVALARRTLAIVRENLAWAFAYNLVAVPLAAMGMVTPLVAGAGMAISSLIVVGNALRLTRGTPRTA